MRRYAIRYKAFCYTKTATVWFIFIYFYLYYINCRLNSIDVTRRVGVNSKYNILLRFYQLPISHLSFSFSTKSNISTIFCVIAITTKSWTTANLICPINFQTLSWFRNNNYNSPAASAIQSRLIRFLPSIPVKIEPS